MKILHLIASVNPAGGGPVEGVKNLGGVITGFGHTVEVGTLDAPDSPWLQDFPLPVHAFGPSKGGFAYSPNLIPWLRSHCHNYDVCIVNGVWQFNSYAAWRVLSKARVPYYVFTHGMLDPWFKNTYPMKHLKKLAYWPIQHKILHDATGVCFTTEEEKLLARESFKPYNVNEIVVSYGTKAPTGDITKQKRTFFDVCPEVEGKRFFLFLSRIHKKKGCDILIRAFAEAAASQPENHLVIAGPDKHNLRPKLEYIASQLGIQDKISWPGMLSGDAKWGAFHAAEAFVLPSHQENFGIAVAEAMACGCPVIISNKVNIWREVNRDGAGIVGSDDVNGTVTSLKTWISLQDDYKARMRENAVTSFNSQFEIHLAAQHLVELISRKRVERIAAR